MTHGHELREETLVEGRLQGRRRETAGKMGQL